MQGLLLVSANVNAGMFARILGNPATGQLNRSFLGFFLGSTPTARLVPKFRVVRHASDIARPILQATGKTQK